MRDVVQDGNHVPVQYLLQPLPPVPTAFAAAAPISAVQAAAAAAAALTVAATASCTDARAATNAAHVATKPLNDSWNNRNWSSPARGQPCAG